MNMGVPATPSGHSRAEPEEVSVVPTSVPNAAWHFIADGEINYPDNTIVYALGRYGDVFGPLPAEMFHPDAWGGHMFHASHDLIAVAMCELDWRNAFQNAASAIEARRAATVKQGAVHESASPKDDAQTVSAYRLREALEAARPVVVRHTEALRGIARILGKGRPQEIADEADELLAKIDAALSP